MTTVRLHATHSELVFCLCAIILVGLGEACGQWRQVTGLSATRIYSLLADNSTLYASAWGISRSTDNGATWTAPTGDPAYQMIIHNGLLEAAIYGQIIVSADSGTTWSYIFLDVEPIFAIVAQGQSVFAGSGILPNGEGGPVGIFRTVDDWSNYVQVNNGFLSVDTRALVSDAISVFAGTANGVFVTTNNGDYWMRTFFGIPDTDITALALRGSLLFAGTSSSHIYRSSDGGWNWTEASQGLPSAVAVRNFAFSGSTMFVGTSGGVFTSLNNGTTWQPTDAGPTRPTDITALAVSGALLFAGDANTGLWVDTLSHLVTDVNGEQSGERPVTSLLSQNYPNPFNPTTTIVYTVGGTGPQASDISEVRLSVYDILGRQVATLVKERKEAGRYSITFDASQLSSGTYFYRLQVGEVVQTQRMVLLR